jgi:thioredoxin:protein disulfide reductase
MIINWVIMEKIMKQFITIAALFTMLAAPIAAQMPEEIVETKIFADQNGFLPGDTVHFAVAINIMNGWHINSHQPFDEFVIPTELAVEAQQGVRWSEIRYPEPHIVNLEALGGQSSTFEGDNFAYFYGIIAQDNVPEKINVSASLRYQGCNDQVCLAPVDKELVMHLSKANSASDIEKMHQEIFSAGSAAKEADIALGEKDDDDFGRTVAEKGMILTLILVFFGGLALNLTPCVYPLIPITVSYFGGQSGNKGSAVLSASMYVLGMSVTYSILGTVAALSGEMFGTLLTNPWVLIGISAIMLILSLSMFGVYEFRLPVFLMQFGGGARSGAIGALMMGLTMGIVAAPCIGPFVIGLLTYVAQQGSAFIGFIMFFTLSLGLGLPYLFLGIFSSRLSALPRSGEWLNGVRIFFGLVLVGMAIYFINPLLPSKWVKIVLPAYMILAGFYYGVIDSSGSKAPWFIRLKMILTLLVVSVGVWMIKPAPENLSEMTWNTWSEAALVQAAEDQKPVVIDFYADWCVPCKELDHFTFSNPQVQAALANWERLKVDLTQDKSDFAQDLINRYNIKGVPTIVFLNENGQEVMAARLTGFENAEAFLKRIKTIQ